MKFLMAILILIGSISLDEDYEEEYLNIDMVFEKEEISERKEPVIIGGKSMKFENQLNYLRVPKKNSEIRIFKKDDKDGENGKTSGEEKSEGETASKVGQTAESWRKQSKKKRAERQKKDKIQRAFNDRTFDGKSRSHAL